MSPGDSAGIGLEGGDETANAFIGAGDTCDDCIVDDEWRHGAAVMLRLVGRHGSLPNQFAARAVKCQQVGVVGNIEDLIPQNGDSAVSAKFRIADHTRAGRTRILPKRIAGESVEGENLVRACDIEHAVRCQGCHLQAEVCNRKKPFQLQ